jgi:predicted tellurium resistance membrane protein TerC
MAMLNDPGTWAAFVTLSALEIILGIDNVIILSILVSRLPQAQQSSARLTGLALAMLTRIALLFSIVWLTRLTQPLFEVSGHVISGRDLALFGGGLFLVGKSVLELHETLEGAARHNDARVYANFFATVVQIAVIDIVFSLDTVFTAIGLARPDQVPIMVAAIVVAIVAMMWMAKAIGRFIDRHPTLKVLALAFLILIGVALITSAFHFEIPKPYLYFAMAFAVGVEAVNLKLRERLDAGRNKRGAEDRS